MTPRVLSFAVLATLLAASAPLVAGGHVAVEFDPCDNVDTPGIRPPVADLPTRVTPNPCGEDPDPCPPTREGAAPLCPTEKAAACLAYGAVVNVNNVATTDFAKSAAAANGAGWSNAQANLQSLNTAVASEATLATQCRASGDPCPSTAGDATAVDVDLLNGLVIAQALESHVKLDCWSQPTVENRFSRVIIAGVELDRILHHSVIHVPGVAKITLDDSDTYVSPCGSIGHTATALRVDLEDPAGRPAGVILVSHVATHVC